MASTYATQAEKPNRKETNKYLDASGHWTVPAGGGGGSSTLAGLDDVNIENPTDGQALVYDAESETFKNGDVAQPEIFNTERDGLVPKSVEETDSKYLRDDGQWAEPIEVITPEYYYAHKEELEASGLTYLVQGTIQGTTDAKTVGYDNTGSGLQSTNVQDAIGEVKSLIPQDRFKTMKLVHLPNGNPSQIRSFDVKIPCQQNTSFSFIIATRYSLRYAWMGCTNYTGSGTGYTPVYGISNICTMNNESTMSITVISKTEKYWVARFSTSTTWNCFDILIMQGHYGYTDQLVFTGVE